MNKSRLDAFSDGVFAIIITIMVLELKVPHGANWATLRPLIPVFLSYLLSFVFIGIYWGNHHHLLHTATRSTSGIMLANLHLLFWLSLLPAATGWMGENEFAPNTVALYAGIALMCGIAFGILQGRILKGAQQQSPLQLALKKQQPKMYISIGACILAVPMAYVHPLIPGVLFLIQSLVWLIPDGRVEQALEQEEI